MFIQRNEEGEICAAFASQQYDDVTDAPLNLPWVNADDPELVAFLERLRSAN